MDRIAGALRSHSSTSLPYRSYRNHLREKFPEISNFRKISVSAGFTCPNLDGTKGRGGCIYCNNKSFSPSVVNSHQSVSQQIENGIQYFSKRMKCDSFIAYFQPFSNTYAPVKYLEKLYSEAFAHPKVKGIAIGTRPDCINEDVIDMLAKLAKTHYVSLELGLQSANDQTLKRINRCDDFRSFTRAMNLSMHKGFEVCVHLILGLPNETNYDFIETAEKLQPWKIDSIKIHPLHVVKGTRLAQLYQLDLYHPLQQKIYVESLANVLERISPDTAIQRFTGDASDDLLIAPTWCKQKSSIQSDLIELFHKRGTRQGSLYKRV